MADMKLVAIIELEATIFGTQAPTYKEKDTRDTLGQRFNSFTQKIIKVAN